MKITLLAIIAAGMLLPLSSGYSSELKFISRVVENSCKMDFSEKGLALNLGDITTQEATNAKGYTTPQVPFSIQLSDCPAEYPFISLSFQGQTDRHDDRLLALDRQSTSSIRGAGVAFYDMNEHITPPRLVPINRGRSAKVETDEHGNARLLFSAAIMADGSVPVPGISQPVVAVTINYE